MLSVRGHKWPQGPHLAIPAGRSLRYMGVAWVTSSEYGGLLAGSLISTSQLEVKDIILLAILYVWNSHWLPEY